MQVNNNILKKIIAIILIVLIGLIIFKPKQESEVEIYESKSQNKQFAMYIEKGNDYEIYNEKQFPNQYRYVLNEEKSYCQDNKGNKVNNLISSNYNGSITVTSNKTVFCYLYFDEEFRGTGLELTKSESNGLSTEIKGDMYRYQGNQTDNIENYICFGTDSQKECLAHPDQYMYRIIGVEESGRIKVIKKEALDQPYQWYSDYVTDVKLPDSAFFQAINGNDFLDNEEYFPTEEWKNKIDDNNWLYGDMWDDDIAGAKQTGAGLYETESGGKPANWYIKSTLEEGGTPYRVGWDGNTVYPQGTTLYYKTVSGNWTDTKKAKISLMYLNDYSYSVEDEAKCNYYYGEEEYAKCKLGWIQLSNNDTSVLSENEWTMTRLGWNIGNGSFSGFAVFNTGYVGVPGLTDSLSIRPVFYLKSGIYFEGKGTEKEPFVIKDGPASTYIKSKNPNGLKLDAIRGDMYRFQGNQTDNIENYICFGTDNQKDCVEHPDQYMYRIIGIEASTGRVKVIKKEALNQAYAWAKNYSDDVKLPDSVFFKAINGNDFLDNSEYVPIGWKDKISNNTWFYGNMWRGDESGSLQNSNNVYQVESGKKETKWNILSTQEEGGLPYEIDADNNQNYSKGTILYYKQIDNKWTDTVISKIGLMYLHDYYYSVGDDANCDYDNVWDKNSDEYKSNGKQCRDGWIYLSINDLDKPSSYEWTMTRYGWSMWDGKYYAFLFHPNGFAYTWDLSNEFSVRPVFYLKANVNISSGDGSENNPFMINL